MSCHGYIFKQKVALVGAARILQNLPGNSEFLCSEGLLLLSLDPGELPIVSTKPSISVVVSSPISVVVSSPISSTEGYKMNGYNPGTQH